MKWEIQLEINRFQESKVVSCSSIYFAIQFLLYEHELIYIRVKEEGFSTKNYLKGMKLLSNTKQVSHLTAICLPGVGDTRILDASRSVCELHQGFLIMTEQDLYDYLTSLQLPVI